MGAARHRAVPCGPSRERVHRRVRRRTRGPAGRRWRMPRRARVRRHGRRLAVRVAERANLSLFASASLLAAYACRSRYRSIGPTLYPVPLIL